MYRFCSLAVAVDGAQPFLFDVVRGVDISGGIALYAYHMVGALCEKVVQAGDRAILGNDDYLHARGIADSEAHFLLTVRGDGHACKTDVGLSVCDGSGDGIELHIVDYKLQSELVCDGGCDLRIYARHFASLDVLIRGKGSVGSHDEPAFLGGGEASVVI